MKIQQILSIHSAKLRAIPWRQDRRRAAQYAYLDYCIAHLVRVCLWDDHGHKYDGHILSHDRNTILFRPVAKTLRREPFLLFKTATQLIIPAAQVHYSVFSGAVISERYSGQTTSVKRKKFSAIDLAEPGDYDWPVIGAVSDQE